MPDDSICQPLLYLCRDGVLVARMYWSGRCPSLAARGEGGRVAEV